MSYILVGGTFNCLHRGHREFLEKAFSIGGRVLICLTSDEMAKEKHLSEKIGDFSSRKSKLEDFISSRGWLERAEIIRIEDPFSEGLRPELTHVVVSSETRSNAERINDMRMEKGLMKMEIVEIGWVMASDGKPISGSRIRSGEINLDGGKS